MKEALLLKRFKAWLLEKKAEVESVLYPKIVDETIWQSKSYQLRNGRKLAIQMASHLDVEGIMAIQKAAYGGTAPWSRLIVYNEIQNPRSFFLIITDQGEAAAFIALAIRTDYLHVTNLGTKPAYQKKGLASFLIENAREIADKLKLKALTLEVRVSNTGARRLYRKIGFHESYLKKNYYTDNGEDAIEMVLPLTERKSESIENDKRKN